MNGFKYLLRRGDGTFCSPLVRSYEWQIGPWMRPCLQDWGLFCFTRPDLALGAAKANLPIPHLVANVEGGGEPYCRFADNLDTVEFRSMRITGWYTGND